MPGALAFVGHVFRGVAHLALRQALGLRDLLVGRAYGVGNLFYVEKDFRSVALDDLHVVTHPLRRSSLNSHR